MWKEIAPGVWEWQEGDTWESLAKILKVNVNDLKSAFPETELDTGVALQPGDLSGGTPTEAKTCNCSWERLRNGWNYGYSYSDAELADDVAYKRNWLNANTDRDFIDASTREVLRAWERHNVKLFVFKPGDLTPGIGALRHAGKTVDEILKLKKGSILNAPLERGAPGWDQIRNQTWEQIESGAKAGKPGYKTIRKLLTDRRFDK